MTVYRLIFSVGMKHCAEVDRRCGRNCTNPVLTASTPLETVPSRHLLLKAQILRSTSVIGVKDAARPHLVWQAATPRLAPLLVNIVNQLTGSCILLVEIWVQVTCIEIGSLGETKIVCEAPAINRVGNPVMSDFPDVRFPVGVSYL